MTLSPDDILYTVYPSRGFYLHINKWESWVVFYSYGFYDAVNDNGGINVL